MGPYALFKKAVSSRYLRPAIAALLFAFALTILSRELGKYHYHEIIRDIAAIPGEGLVFSALSAAADYLALACFDLLAIIYIGKRLPYGKIALTSFIGYTFTHNIGLSVLSGGSVRYYMYLASGLSAIEIAAVIAFTVATFAVGLITAGGLVILLEPEVVPEFLKPSWIGLEPLGGALLFLTGAYLFACRFRKVPVSFRGWDFRLPSLALAAGQILAASLDWVFVSGVLYWLLPEASAPPYYEFVGYFILANVAGMISHVPGGLGVFEASLLFLLTPEVPRQSVVSALIVFRALYYLLPFAIALGAFGLYEVFKRRLEIRRAFGSLSAEGLSKTFFPAASFLSGAALILSGLLPSEGLARGPAGAALQAASGAAGALLMLASRGVQMRLNSALRLTLALLAAGAFLAFIAGANAAVPGFLLAALLVFARARERFARKGRIMDEPLTTGWITANLLVTVAALSAFGVLYHAFDPGMLLDTGGGPSQAVKAIFGAGAVYAAYAAAKALKKGLKPPGLPGEGALRTAYAIAERSGEARGLLALDGTKRLLFNAKKDAFMPIYMAGKSWITTGPVGSGEGRLELGWRFAELASAFGARPVFHDIPEDYLPVIAGLGLVYLKIGEEGRLPLGRLRPGDSLEGPEGLAFRLSSGKAAEDIAKRLYGADAALGGLMRRFPLGAVFRGESPVAAAFLLKADRGREAAAGRVFLGPDAPPGALRFLVARLAAACADEGGEWFSLGLSAPTDPSGFAPFLESMGNGLWTFGEFFPDATALRAFMEGFAPLWQGRYLAYEGGFALPHILADIGRISSAGTLQGQNS